MKETLGDLALGIGALVVMFLAAWFFDYDFTIEKLNVLPQVDNFGILGVLLFLALGGMVVFFIVVVMFVLFMVKDSLNIYLVNRLGQEDRKSDLQQITTMLGLISRMTFGRMGMGPTINVQDNPVQSPMANPTHSVTPQDIELS